HFFFLLTRPPPLSTLFPYTTLFRSVRRRQIDQLAGLIVFASTGNRADLVEAFLIDQFVDTLANGEPALVALPLDLINASHLARRSEEHTSELQSLAYLVCRLLLEKK